MWAASRTSRGVQLLVKAAVVALAVLLWPGLSDSAQSGRRVALVIGNSAYQVGSLANPGNDAEAVARTLRDLDFDKVILKMDLALAEMRAALKELAAELAGAEIGAVFFAGHGTEVGGRNYLIPIDARLARAADIDLEAISLDTVLGQLEGVSKLKLVILDACRNNVFPLAGGRRSQTRGLARVEPEDNTLIAYAAREGTTADDGGSGPHSPFTAALLRHLATPGVDVDYVFRLVRDDVMAATGRQQQPHLYGSLGRERIILRPGPPPPAVADASPAQPPSRPTLEPFDVTIRVMLGKVAVDGAKRGPLAVGVETVKAGRLALFGQGVRHGVLVAQVPAEAAAAGLRPLDLIAEIDGTIPNGASHFAKLVRDRPSGHTAELRIRRLARSTTEAVQGLHRLSERNGAAQALLGLLYGRGIAVAVDYAQAAHWNRKAAEAGDAESMSTLGYMLEKGIGVAKDGADASRWYRRAAEAGEPEGMYNFGVALERGLGVAKNEAEAVRWFRKAVEAGDAGSMSKLGLMFSEGRGVAKDEAEAVRWFLKGAEAGDAGAMFNLGRCLDEGRGTARNPPAAAQWMLKALRADFDLVNSSMRMARTWSAEFRRELQRLMKDEGLYSGPINGNFGAAAFRAALDKLEPAKE